MVVKTVFFSCLNHHKNVVFLIDCCDGETNKFPFIKRQLHEEIVQREDDGNNLFSLNFAKYGDNTVECWSEDLRYASVGNIVQASHWIKDRVGLSSIGQPTLLPAIRKVMQSNPGTSPPDCITVVTDHPPQERLGDILLSLEVKGQVVALNVVYLYHVTRGPSAVDMYSTLCSKTGGELKVIELSCEGDLLNCETIVENNKVCFTNKCQCCHSCFLCVKQHEASCSMSSLAPCPPCGSRVRVEPTHVHTVCKAESTTPPRISLQKNSIVLAKRNSTEGYFFLAKVLDSSLTHEKLVEFLETGRCEITKCSDYDLIDIQEAMKYSIFPGSRVLGKIDTQRFCPGTVLHGSLDASTLEDRNRNAQDNLVIEYCNGEVTSTVPSRLIRIPESLFYWLKKFFPACELSEGRARHGVATLDINAETSKLCLRDDSSLKNKLDRFFDEGDQQHSKTSWYRHKYSHLPHYDFDKNKYGSDNRQLIKWYQERSRRPMFVDSDSDGEDDYTHGGIQFGNSSQGRNKLQLKKSWHDQYLNLRQAENEQEWYKKLLQRENEILRRKFAKHPKSGLSSSPPPWRHWLKQGAEPPPEFQKPPRSANYPGHSVSERHCSELGMHVLPSSHHDSLFSKTPTGFERDNTTVKRLLIQTDPKNPPGSRDKTEVIYPKRW